MSADLKSRLQADAATSGFDLVRVTTPDRIGAAGERLRAFLADGRHGDMDWMATHADRRADPRVLWSDVRSIIMLAISYAPAENPIATDVAANRAVISAYARGRDYHDIVKKGLKRIASNFATASGADVKVFVDTAPLMEKPLAQSAGIGWQGKHTNLVSRQAGGSWLFLGAILTTAAIEPDAPETDHCGTCTRCLDVCPTHAFPAPYQLDARRCIAYLTIEHKGHIARGFREAIGNRVFGCDDCLAVCPWNKFAEAARDIRFHARAETDNPPLDEILALDDASFRTRFAGTPVKRTGRDRVVRNALIAAGNARDPALRPVVTALLADPSPLVRAMAVWAISRMANAHQIAELRTRHLPSEPDPAVRAEWLHPGTTS
ncbi:MAG TPA: tRNA epoxyqueuosine(34) reductase QueG [Hyphomicrobiaceae bacterium]|nr:tRNA epoxyqueuosine(34) reductase QueG [Hyphomicrobiaceae bacterium]